MTTPQQPPPSGSTAGLGRRLKVWLIVTAIALVLTIAGLVAGRVLLGKDLPGQLLVGAIALIAAIVMVRSGKSAARKAVTVATIALVVAAAIPASLKWVYPAYHHFFKDGTSQASRHSPGAPGSPDSAPAGDSDSAPPSGGATSGILVIANPSGNGQHRRVYGFIDPDSGSYSEAASFDIKSTQNVSAGNAAVSPDLTKLAVTQNADGHQSAGWIDTSGNFTNVTPATDPGPFGGNPPFSQSIGFDGSGNFYYTTTGQTSTGSQTDAYKLAAGSTSGAQKLPETRVASPVALDYDGSMLLGCTEVTWLGPNSLVSATGSKVTKYAVTRGGGCPVQDYSASTQLLPTANTANVIDAVGNHDGTKVAFKYYGAQGTILLYLVGADGSSQPTQLNVTGQQVSDMELIGWR